MEITMTITANTVKYIFIYLYVINTITFIYMGLDKYRAIKQKWRIQELALFLLAIIGGAVGILLGMTMFRHKTLHKRFYVGIPIIVIAYYVLFIFLLFRYL